MPDAEPEEPEEPEEPSRGPGDPDVAFDTEKHEIVVDLQALCSIPYDAETSAIESFRAFQFEKGRVKRAPEPGMYAWAGKQTVLHSLMLVHFKPKTLRKPELVLSFADYGMVSNTAVGIFVCSLPLPLMKRKGCYENVVRYTPINDVAGFSAISHSSAPWSMHLEPTLQKLGGAHDSFKCYNKAGVTEFLARPLAEKINMCQEAANHTLSKFLDSIRRQDPAIAEKQRAQFTSQLMKTVDFLNGLSPSNYDKPLDERLLHVVEGTTVPGTEGWLTPSKTSRMLAGEMQEALVRTAKCQRALLAQVEPAAPNPAPSIPHAPSGAPDEGQELLVLEEPYEDAVGGSKRARKPPEHFEFRKEARSKLKSQKEIDANLINPRSGKPYMRGPYGMDKKVGLSSAVKDAKFKEDAAPNRAQKDKDAETIAKLKKRVSELEEEVKLVQKALDREKAASDLAIANAEFKGRSEMHDQMLKQYQQGLMDGANLATGKSVLRGFKLGGFGTVGSSSSAGSSLE